MYLIQKILALVVCLCFSFNHLNAKLISTIPFQLKQGLIIIEGSISDQKGKFLIDTGSSDILINKDTKNGNVVLSSIYGDVNALESTIDKIEIGDHTFSNKEALSFDFKKLGLNVLEDISGIIGISAFKNLILELDYSNLVISIHDNKSDVEINKDSYIKIPIFSYSASMPIIELNVNNKLMKFCLDTGANNHVLDKIHAHLLNEENTLFYSHKGTNIFTRNKKAKHEGSLEFEIKDTSALNFGTKIDGVISLTKLGLKHFIFNFSTGHLLIEKSL